MSMVTSWGTRPYKSTPFGLIFAELPKPIVQSPVLSLERPGTSRNCLVSEESNKCFFFFQYCMTKEMKPKQIPQDDPSRTLIFIIYYVSSVKASAPLTVKAPSTNSAPLLPLLGASRVGNLDDGTPQLQYPATIHEVLEEGRPYKSCSIIQTTICRQSSYIRLFSEKNSKIENNKPIGPMAHWGSILGICWNHP